MNPFRLLILAQQIITASKNGAGINPHHLCCAKQIRLHTIAMTLIAICMFILLVWLIMGRMHCWSAAIEWHHRGARLWNIPGLMLLTPFLMYLQAMTVLFAQKNSHHGQIVLALHGLAKPRA